MARDDLKREEDDVAELGLVKRKLPTELMLSILSDKVPSI